jgi:hypothetical protein
VEPVELAHQVLDDAVQLSLDVTEAGALGRHDRQCVDGRVRDLPLVTVVGVDEGLGSGRDEVV